MRKAVPAKPPATPPLEPQMAADFPIHAANWCHVDDDGRIWPMDRWGTIDRSGDPIGRISQE